MEASVEVMISMFFTCCQPTSILLDQACRYSYGFSYFSTQLGLTFEPLVVLMHLVTPVCDSFVVDQVFRSCAETIIEYDSLKNICELDMVDFNAIIGME